ncbi:MAG: SDR family NAD(P)-dependent oxidoreductase [Pirellulales bacterium]|jgi:3-oxoacyl-[acyl-carrier protein] reductase
MSKSVQQLFSLAGKTALITGGSKGIGKAIARGFAEVGANIYITARHEDELKQAAAEIGEGLDVQVEYRVCDMIDRNAVDQLTAGLLNTAGRIDILVNNAGSNDPQNLVDTTDESWDRILELNLTSCMRLARGLAPAMIANNWGRIIHLSSVMAVASNAARGAYSGTKAALLGMARAHALELGPHGITVNSIAPGPIATDLPMNLLSDQQKKQFSDRTALLRWGQTIEMVGPALLLASDAGAYITGTMILAEGGMMCRTFE